MAEKRTLKEHRLAVGMTQARLAELAGISTMNLYRYERGQVEPSATALAALARALDVPMEAISLEPWERKGTPPAE